MRRPAPLRQPTARPQELHDHPQVVRAVDSGDRGAMGRPIGRRDRSWNENVEPDSKIGHPRLARRTGSARSYRWWPSRTRTLDPLIKSPAGPSRIDTHHDASSREIEKTDRAYIRVCSRRFPYIGTGLEPEPAGVLNSNTASTHHQAQGIAGLHLARGMLASERDDWDQADASSIRFLREPRQKGVD